MPSRSDPPVFNLQDANGAIPNLTRTLPELRRVRREIDRLDDRVRILEILCDPPVTEGNPDLRELRTMRRRSERKVARFESTLAEMEERGHHLIDLDRGVVHFEARKGSVPILLCWNDERRRKPLGDPGD